METTGADTTSTFSFGTESPWLGLDLATLEIHSRARMLQSKQRAERLRRKNLALSHLLEMAQAQRHIEVDIRRTTARKTEIIPPSAEDEIELRAKSEILDLRMKNALDDRDGLRILRESQPRAAASRRWG